MKMFSFQYQHRLKIEISQFLWAGPLRWDVFLLLGFLDLLLRHHFYLLLNKELFSFFRFRLEKNKWEKKSTSCHYICFTLSSMYFVWPSTSEKYKCHCNTLKGYLFFLMSGWVVHPLPFLVDTCMAYKRWIKHS